MRRSPRSPARCPDTFRAPHGYHSPFVGPAVAPYGYRSFGWTFGVCDSDRPGTELIRTREESG
jgi:hypothetical protein